MDLWITERWFLSLRRAIGAEGHSLLKQFNLLTPLVEQMVAREATAVVVPEGQLEEAQLGLAAWLRRHGAVGGAAG